MNKIPYWACLIMSQVHLARFETVNMAIGLSIIWLILSLVIGYFMIKEPT
jgi:hypothetical protein